MMNILWQRMVRAAKLDVGLYEEVEKDKTTLRQAMGVVLLSALAAGIGSGAKVGIGGIIVAAIIGLLGWYTWAMLTYLIGTKLMPEPQTKADLGELLRTIGFASAPGVIRILGVIEGFQSMVFSLAGAWMLVAMVIAVKSALDYKNIWRAVGVCLIGWLIQLLLISFLITIAGGVQQPA
ncbi:MAG: YIP1 family protein [Candidatus Omnitrophota bacterium]